MTERGHISIEMHYLQLQDSFVWRDLLEKLEAEVQKQKDKFFEPDFSEKPEKTRLRATYYEEFLKIMKSKVNRIAMKAKSNK